MSFFNRLFKELLGVQDYHSQDEIHVREQLVRSEMFLKDFEKWKAKGVHKALLEHIYANWQLKCEDASIIVNMEIFQNKTSDGFYFRAETPWDAFDYDCFIQWIIERCISKGYALKNASREVVEEGGLLKSIEHFYLKPSLKFRRELPYEQFWGNIEIEHRLVNQHSRIVKLMANTYQDRSYKSPHSFDAFMQYIFLP